MDDSPLIPPLGAASASRPRVLHTWGSAMTHHRPCPYDRPRRGRFARRRALDCLAPAFLLPVTGLGQASSAGYFLTD